MTQGDSSVWTVGRILQWTTGFFGHHKLDSPRLDAEILIAHALNCQRVELYTRHSMPLSPEDRAGIRELVRRRSRDREPVAYIVGRKEFYGLSFQVSPEVLIPRPETESLVEAALEFLGDLEGQKARVLDVGTGSGAIAIALANKNPDIDVVATDISEPALNIARKNAEAHGLESRIKFVSADGLSFIGKDVQPGERFQLLISNPPYIDPAVEGSLAPEILRHEPHKALFADKNGDAFLSSLIAGVNAALVDGGALFLEVGTLEQAERCAQKMTASGDFTTVSKVYDVAKVARGVCGVVGKTDPG